MKKLLHWLDQNLEAVICAVLMCVMTIIIFIQVIMRYVFKNSLAWSEEFARYCFVWLIYVGAAYACRKMQHIKIDASLLLFPKKVRPYIVILGELLVITFSVYILLTGTSLMNFQIAYNKVSPAMEIPMAVVNAAPVAGFALIIIRQVQVVFCHVSQFGKEEKEGDE